MKKSLYSKSILLLVLLFSIFSTESNAQKKIKLTNNKSGKILFINEGQRVQYQLKDNLKKITGTLNKIESTYLIISDTQIEIEKLKSLGRNKKGSGAGVFVLGLLGAGLIATALTPDQTPECTNCQTISSTGEGEAAAGDAILAVGGLTLSVLAVNKSIKNSPRDLIEKWKLEIIESSN